MWVVTDGLFLAPRFISIYKRELDSVTGHRSVLGVLKFGSTLGNGVVLYLKHLGLGKWLCEQKHEDPR